MASESSRVRTGPRERLRCVGRALRDRAGKGHFPYWRQANVGLGLVAFLLALWTVWLLFARVPAAAMADIPPRRDRAEADDQQGLVYADYRKWVAGKKLFVLPVPSPTSLGLDDQITRAKQNINLCGITEIGGRMGAYFEVKEGNATSFGLYFEGDQVGGFVVSEIGPSRVVVMIAEQEVAFSL